MLKVFAGSALLVATLALPATAQTGGTSSPQAAPPSTQNSGTGVQGMPGNKNGPAAKSGTTGAAPGNSGTNTTTQQQDSSGVKGMPGNKNGPPARQPSQK